MERKEYIFIDGGGTKTHGELWRRINDEEYWEKISTFTLEQMCNTAVSVDISFDSLNKVTKKLLQDAETLPKVVVAIAGFVKTEEVITKIKMLFETLEIKELQLFNDVEFLLEAFGHDKMISIFGSGSSHIIGLGNNESKIIGGWGHLLGDEGSTYSISLKFIKKSLLEIDFNLDDGYKKYVYEFYNINSREELIAKIYKSKDKTIISNLLKFLFQNLNKKEKQQLLLEILIHEAEEVISVYQRVLDKNPQINHIFLNGGMVSFDNYFINKIEDYLKLERKINVTIINWDSIDESNPIISYIKK